MAEEQDKGYRLLFSFPGMVEELLRRFVGGAWVQRLEFETLQKVSERDISPQLVRREKDLLWRLRYRTRHNPSEENHWFYLYLHLEFESTPRRFMALRILTYQSLLYEELVRRNLLISPGLLPPVLSVVLYNGQVPWTAPLSMEELLAPLPDTEAGELPRGLSLLSYDLIDEQAYPQARLEDETGPVATLFQLEKSRTIEDLRHATNRLIQRLEGGENRSLREAFAEYLRTSLVPAMVPGAALPEIKDLLELKPMLEQRARQWRDEWKQEGLQEGLREGLQEGLQEGERKGEGKVLLRQLEKKFGRVDANVRTRIEEAQTDELLEWAERLVVAETLDEIFLP